MRTPSRMLTLTSRSIRIALPVAPDCVGAALSRCCVMCLPRVALCCIVTARTYETWTYKTWTYKTWAYKTWAYEKKRG